MTASPSFALQGRRVLVTGSSRRIGAAIVKRLHADGARVGIHYRSSADDASVLAQSLNDLRENSAATFQADLDDFQALESLVGNFSDWQGGIDVLINNASTFYPTPLGAITESDWERLTGSNLKAPLFLSQAAAASLRENNGAIVNIVDIHARRPLRDHAVYGAAKAGLEMLTRALAKDLAPEVRVNGVAPGAILWPENELSDTDKSAILRQIPLQRSGTPEDIADCVHYLLSAPYVTGQIIAVDGGRSIGW